MQERMLCIEQMLQFSLQKQVAATKPSHFVYCFDLTAVLHFSTWCTGPPSIGDGQGFDSPTSTKPVRESEDAPLQASPSPFDIPGTSPRQMEGPLLQASSSPTPRAIPFMNARHPSSPAHQNEVSLDVWNSKQGAGGDQQGYEGWANEDDDWFE